MNVEELKEQARRHEQREEWQKAFDLYSTALRTHDEDEPPDITLYNRVGDIQTRLGQVNGAVEQYETAISLYLEAELPNNAIAVCKKVLRNLPERNVFFLRMGQIRAGQGFLTDARQNFLTYAERQTALGDIESALNALIEFVEISPEDVEIRQSLASQLEAHGRVDEAVEQYQEVYRRMALAGKDEEAGAAAEKVSELAPGVTLPDVETLRSEEEKEEPGELVLESTSLGGLELEDWGEDEGTFEGVEVELEEEPAEGAGVEAGGRQVTEETGESTGEGGDFDLSEFDLGELEPVELEADKEDGYAEEAVELSEEAGGESELEGADGLQEEVGEDEDSLPSFDFEAPEEAEDVEIVSGFSFQDEEVGEGESVETDEEPDLPFIGFEEDEEGEVVPSGVEASDRGESPPEETAGGVTEVDLGDDLPFLDLDEEEEEEEAAVEALPEVSPEEPGLGPPLEEPTPEPPSHEEKMAAAVEEATFEERAVEAPPGMEGEETPAEATAGAEDVSVQEEPGEAESAVEPGPAVEIPPVVEDLEDHKAAADRGDMDLAMARVRALLEDDPDDVELHQRLVEYAFRRNDPDTLISAYLDLAGCLARNGAPLKAKAVYQQVLSMAPGHEAAEAGLAELEGVSRPEPPSQVTSSEEYVDLGSMILGDEAEKTTRWKVAAEAPSGDEEADFAKMLSQFKEKVSEHVASDDVSAHHDLGTAYMEMGLFDEAVGEFQMALRASPNHLPTHEVMGRCWMQMGKPDMAVRALERALRVPYEVEDELIGIYYLLGRAHEDRGNREEALEFYEKVFSLDINFEDVTERLRALR